MANGSSRVLPVIISLVVGAVLGLLLGRQAQQLKAPPAEAPAARIPEQDWSINVGLDPCDLKAHGQKAAWQRISKKGYHSVIWHSLYGGRLTIRIHVPKGCTVPFPGMTPAGKDGDGLEMYSFIGADGQCYTSPASKDACETDEPGDPNDTDPKHFKNLYKYDQIIANGKECDGWIIIKP